MEVEAQHVEAGLRQALCEVTDRTVDAKGLVADGPAQDDAAGPRPGGDRRVVPAEERFGRCAEVDGHGAVPSRGWQHTHGRPYSARTPRGRTATSRLPWAGDRATNAEFTIELVCTTIN